MSNPNLSSLLFICLMIISSRSFILSSTLDECTETGLRHQLMWGTSKNDILQTTFDDDHRRILDLAANGVEEFNYIEGNQLGPLNWGTLKPDWQLCAKGTSQSPIDIVSNSTQVTTSALKRAYLDTSGELINGVNNIGVLWEGDAGGIEIDGSIYKLFQCHWHTPSEHTIDGKRFQAELHLVHKNDKGNLAVVGILHEIGPPDPFIESLTEKINVVGINQKIHLMRIIAANINYGSKRNYRYMGSLTTPPCTENVIWTIEEKVRPITMDQIYLLKGSHKYVAGFRNYHHYYVIAILRRRNLKNFDKMLGQFKKLEKEKF